MGKRGPKKGVKYKPTLTKEAARDVVRSLVIAQLQPMVDAQIANAQGLRYLVYRNKKSGKFERVKDLEGVNQDEETIEVWEKDPSVQAFTDLMNRTLDKPAEHVELTGAGGQPLEVRWKESANSLVKG